MNEVKTNEPIEQVHTPAEKAKQKMMDPVKKAKRSLFNTPWVLMTVPLLFVAMAGGVWLGNNTQVITDNINKPFALLIIPTAVASVLVLWLVVNFFKAIANWCKATLNSFTSWRQKEGSTFWIVIAVFLIVSVLESGTFFNELLGPNSLFGTLGYASALVIDLVSVECMRARQKAVRKHDRSGERLYQVGVIVCAFLSAFGNVYTALEHFKDPTNTQIPDWMIHMAPVVGVIFPLLMVFLSFAGDYTADQAHSSLDPEQFAKSEQARIRFFEIQRDTLSKRVQIETEIDRLSNRLKQRREFFLVRWLFPKAAPGVVQVVDQVIEEMRKLYDPQLQLLTNQVQLATEQNQWLRSELLTLTTESKQAYGLLAWGVHQRIEAIDTQKDTDLYLLTEKISEAQNVTMERVQDEINQSKDEVITVLQHRLNESQNVAIERMQNEIKEARKTIVSECVSECLSVVQSAQFEDDEHPFSREDDLSFDEGESDVLDDMQNDDETDVETAVETPSNESKKATKTTKKNAVKTGYKIECDPVVQEIIQMYPIVERWRSTRAKSATIEEIKEVTGHTNKMVTNRALDGTLKKTSRKPNAYTMESIIKWLSTAPVPRSKNAEKEDVQLSVEVPQTPPVEVQVNDIENDMQTDENEADDLTDTGEHEVITEEVLEEGMNALKDLDLRDYQPVPKALEMSA
jgi:hypothetical protein